MRLELSRLARADLDDIRDYSVAELDAGLGCIDVQSGISPNPPCGAKLHGEGDQPKAGGGATRADLLALLTPLHRTSCVLAWPRSLPGGRHRGMSQAALARKAGLSQVWISRI
jgi:hypothetical protein